MNDINDKKRNTGELLLCSMCEIEFDPLFEGVTAPEGSEICWNCQCDIVCGFIKDSIEVER